ncbi:MAG TPA: hypothetical protein VK776_24310 [Bryobacteraceae bacterium]|nr:hypothetical protein [Bryobacteraceae bacterium]
MMLNTNVTLENASIGVHASSGAHPSSQPAAATLWFPRQIRIFSAIVLLYALGFILFFPKALTNFDEVSYVRHAAAFAAGRVTVDTVDPYTGEHQSILPSSYPAGTSALMVPFIWIAGWRGAFLLGLVAAIACTLITAKWITESGGSPLFALIILGYIPTLVMSRTAMSDVPSAALVAAGLWLFWRDDGGPWRRLAAGFIAGASLSLREPNPILFSVFFAGALLRRERHLLPLIGGTIAGVAIRPLSALLVYGSPMYTKLQYYGFTGHYIQLNLLLYLTAVLILVPGGLIFALGYRGRRWPELVSTVALFVGMFILYNYNGQASGGLKQWVLSQRFLIPLLPIMAFAMAHTCPRWYAAAMRSISPDRRMRWHSIAKVAVATWLVAIVLLGLGVNWRSDLWSKVNRDIVDALYSNTDPSLPVVTDIPATDKFLNELHGQRMLAELTGIQAGQIRQLIDRHRVVQVVFFDRLDSDYWLSKAKQNRILLDNLSTQFSCTQKLQQNFPDLGVLQIWTVTSRP